MSQDLQSMIGKRFDLVEITRERRSGWEVGVVPSFVGGLNDRLPADLIKDSEVPILENLSFIGGRLKSDTGYIKFASLLDDVPKGMFEHKQADGSATRLCVTNKTVYKYNITHEEWQVIEGAATTTLAADMDDDHTQVTVVSDTGFTVGSVFAVVLDDGTQMIREVATLPGSNVITFVTAPGGTPGVVATSGNTCVEGAELAGDDDNQVVFDAVPSNEWSIFTNGVNPPYRYDATSDTVVTIASLSSGSLAATTICKTLGVYKSSVILANLIEAGTYRNYKLQWCDPGIPTAWASGNAGDNSLLDSRDAIMAIKPIGASMGIYRSNSIVTMGYQGGSGDSFFRFDVSIYGEVAGSQGVGAVSPNAVFALPDEALVLTSDGVYLYRGGFNINLVSDDVFEGTFSARGDMDGQNLGQNFVHFFDRTNEVFCFYRSTAATAFPDKALIINLGTGAWRKRSFSDEITSAADTTDAPTFTAIDDLVGTINEQAWLLGSDAVVSGIGTVLLGTVTALYVMEYNYIAPDDDGTAIVWEVQTKDFDGVDTDILMDWVELEFGAVSGTVSYSTDSGQNWVAVGTVSGDVDVIPRRYDFSFADRKFRFRATGSGGGAEIGKLAFKHKPSYVSP